MQFMRGPRVLEVTDPKKSQNKSLYLAHSLAEAVAYWTLKAEPGEDGEIKWVTPEGDEAEVMILNDRVASDTLFERVRLTLDTGREASRLERMEQAEMVLQSVGPAAIPWAAKQLDWANSEELLEAVAKRDAGLQQLQMAEEFKKETGLDIMEALQKVKGALGKGGGPGGPHQPEGPMGAGPPAPPPGGPPNPMAAMAAAEA